MKSLSENYPAFTLIAATIYGVGAEGAEAKVSVIKVKKD